MQPNKVFVLLGDTLMIALENYLERKKIRHVLHSGHVEPCSIVISVKCSYAGDPGLIPG